MKKIVGLLALVLSVFALAACGATEKTTVSLDGEYVRFLSDSKNDEITLSDVKYGLTISGDKGTDRYESKDFTIDEEKQVIVYPDEKYRQFDEEYPYTFEDDILSFDGKTYVKVGSAKHKEIQDEIEKIKEN